MKLRKITFLTLLFTLLCLAACTNDASELGKPYPGWQEGELEIHHIYTGRGESNFFIFPDSTTLLVDAGDYDPEDYLLMAPAFPDDSRRSGEWISRYIRRVNPRQAQVDYFLLSHFHSDHMGSGDKGGGDEQYVVSGISEVAQTIHFDRLLDRDYPDYAYPCEQPEEKDLVNYRRFITYGVQSSLFQVSRFEAGQKNQIALRHAPEKYGDFEIQNLVSSGVLWSGEAANTDSLFVRRHSQNSCMYNENTLSTGFRLSFGPFRYFTAGDLSGAVLDKQGQSIDIEEAVASVCGAVDVCKVNHHGYLDAMSEGFVKHLRAEAYIFPVWDYQHVQASVIQRIMTQKASYKNTPSLFFTYIAEDIRENIKRRSWARQVAKENGHVIVKVFDQGKQYKIYVVSALDERGIVKAVYGPYDAGHSKE